MACHPGPTAARLGAVGLHIGSGKPLTGAVQLGVVDTLPHRRVVPRHQRLAGHAPRHRIRPPAGYQVAPVTAHHLLARYLHEVAPCADDHRHQVVVDQRADAPVGGIEVVGVDGGESPDPTESRPRWHRAGRKGHVRVESGDHLYDVEPLVAPVGGELLERFRLWQAIHQPHPPRVGQPQEWRAVAVAEVPPVLRQGRRTMAV